MCSFSPPIDAKKKRKSAEQKKRKILLPIPIGVNCESMFILRQIIQTAEWNLRTHFINGRTKKNAKIIRSSESFPPSSFHSFPVTVIGPVASVELRSSLSLSLYFARTRLEFSLWHGIFLKCLMVRFRVKYLHFNDDRMEK